MDSDDFPCMVCKQICRGSEDMFEESETRVLRSKGEE